MHELSVAQNIVDIVVSEAEKAGAVSVSKVILTIGELAGIENDALYFAWEVVVKNNIANGSTLVIESVPGEAQCNNCRHRFRTSDYFTVCEKCGDFKTEIIKGKELQVKYFRGQVAVGHLDLNRG